jgi:serine/threonine protein kinase
MLNIQTAGKAVGAGAYGCVFRPPIKCIGDNPEGNFVSKVLIDYEAENEFNQYKNINIIDPDFKYHLQVMKPCSIDISDDYTLEQLIDSKSGICEEIFEDVYDNTNYSSDFKIIQMQDGGESLNSYKRQLSFIESIDGLMNIAMGVREMSSYGYGHFDLKELNIVVSPETKDFKMIDFGFMTKFKYCEIHDNVYEMETTGIYPYYPLELGILFLKSKDDITRRTKYKRYYRMVSQLLDGLSNGLSKRIGTMSNVYITNSMQKMLSKEYFNYVKQISYSDYKRDIYQKLDIYSLGIIIHKVVYNSIKYKNKRYEWHDKSEIDKRTYRKLHMLINRMCDIHTERISIEDVLQELSSLLVRRESSSSSSSSSRETVPSSQRSSTKKNGTTMEDRRRNRTRKNTRNLVRRIQMFFK